MMLRASRRRKAAPRKKKTPISALTHPPFESTGKTNNNKNTINKTTVDKHTNSRQTLDVQYAVLVVETRPVVGQTKNRFHVPVILRQILETDGDGARRNPKIGTDDEDVPVTFVPTRGVRVDPRLVPERVAE